MIDNIGNINQNNIAGLNTANTEKTQGVGGLKTNSYATFNRDYLIDESQISKDAIKLYENEKDIKNFTKLALDGFEDDTQTEELMQNLFAQGVVDIDDDSVWTQIAANNDLMDDILG